MPEGTPLSGVEWQSAMNVTVCRRRPPPASWVDSQRPAADHPWTEKLWVYDLRTNEHFTLKQNPLRREHLQDFVTAYRPGEPRSNRMTSERFRSFGYDELAARDKANLDITWLRDESLEDLGNRPAPEMIAREIVEDLTAALAEFEAVAAALERVGTAGLGAAST
jgi:type I restriction enzyme M protein